MSSWRGIGIALFVLAQACVPHPLRTAPTPAPIPVDERVMEYGPVGELDSDSDSVKIRFDREMVVLGPLGFLDAGDLLHFDPPIPGRAQWRGPDLIVFSTGRLPRGTTYTATLTLPRELAGDRPFAPLSWQFTTPRPRCALFDPPPPRTLRSADEPILVECSGTIARGNLADLVSARAGARALPIEVTLLSDHRSNEPVSRNRLAELAANLPGVWTDSILVVRPRAPWPTVRRITLQLSPDLRMEDGPLPLGSEAVFVVQDIPALQAVEVVCNSQRELEAWFSMPVPVLEIARLSVTPAPAPHEAVPRYRGMSADGLTWGYTIAQGASNEPYTVEVPGDLTDEVGQLIASQARFSVKCPPEKDDDAPFLDGNATHGNLTALLDAAKPRRVSVALLHPSSATVAATSIADDDLLRILPRLLGWRAARADDQRLDWLPAIESSGLPIVTSPVRDTDDAVDLGRVLRPHDRTAWIEIRDAMKVKTAGIYQVSPVAMQAWLSEGPGLVHVMRVSDAAPFAGALIHRFDRQGQLTLLGRTDSRGLLRLREHPTNQREEATEPSPEDEPTTSTLLVATDQHRRVLGFIEEPGDLDAHANVQDGIEARLTTPRDLYAPGETVHFVGFLAISDWNTPVGFSDVPDGRTAVVELVRNGVVARTRAPIKHGKVWGSLAIPATTKPGDYALELSLADDESERQGGAIQHIKVGTYTPSDVTLSLSADHEVLLGEPIRAAFSANFRSGGKVALARAEASLSCTSDAPTYRRAHLQVPVEVSRDELVRGAGRFQVVPALEPSLGPWHCTLSLTVWDEAARSESGSVTLLLHPTHYYLHATVDERPGDPTPEVVIQALDWHDHPVAVGGLELVALGEDSLQAFRTWRLDLPAAKTKFLLSGLSDGDYLLRVRGKDGARTVEAKEHFGRHTRTDDGFPACPPAPVAELLIEAPEKAQVGRAMQVAVHAPAKARAGMLVVTRNGVQAASPLSFVRGRAQVAVPVPESWFPHISLAASATVTSRWKAPTLLEANAEVAIESPRRQLAVTIDAPKKAAPSSSIEAMVRIRDGLGQAPKHARVAFWAVDEGVLALTDYHADLESPKPVDWRETLFAENVSHFIQPAGLDEPNDTALPCRHRALSPAVISGAACVRGGAEAQPPRSRFETTPFFAGDLPVDEQGEAKVRFTLPHNLTTFRLTAIASAGLGKVEAPVAVGTGDALLQTSLPFLVKPVFVGKLRPGDEADAVGLVQNLSGIAGDLAFSVEVTDGSEVLSTLGGAPAAERVENGDTRRLAVRLRAQREGRATVRWRASLRSGDATVAEDAAELSVEVLAEPKPRELVARMGRISRDETKHLRLPLPPAGAAWSQAEFQVRLSGNLVAEVEPAWRELLGYPFSCAEQTASRIVALALAPNRIRPQDKERARVLEDVDRQLAKLPFDQGKGIGFWPKAEPDLFATAWMALALATAQRAQVPLDKSFLEQARTGLLHLVSNREAEQLDALSSLALFGLAEAGATLPEPWKARLDAERGATSAFVSAMTVLALHASSPKDERLRPALSRLARGLDEGDATARVTTARDGFPAWSHTVEQAAVLWAFARAWPEHPVVAKLTQTLLSLRRGPAWNSTFENAMALFAVSALGDLGDAAPGRVSLDFGDETLLKNLTLPEGVLTRSFPLESLLASSAGLDQAPVTLAANTSSGLWYTALLSYVPADQGGAVDHGISIATPYRTRFGMLGSHEPVGEGEIVAVDVSLRTQHDIEHVAVDVPLPAGFEPYDLDLAGRAAALPPNLAPLRQLPVDNLEIYPDRARLFVTHLPHGLPLRYTVYAVAKLPGTYAAPGATAQAMYAPGTRGRSLSRPMRILAPAELDQAAANFIDTLGR